MIDGPPQLAVLISFSGQGGVERMVLNLLEELGRRQLRVDLLPIRAASPEIDALPPTIRKVDLAARHAWSSVPAVARYLRRHRPPVLLAAKDRAGRAALRARRVSGTDTRVMVRLGTNLSAALEGRSWLQRVARERPMRRVYRAVDRIIAVSQGVADDTRRITGLPASRITVVRNPVITPRLARLAAEPNPHPWLEEDPPVLLGAGRLTRQKDFETLIRAFALLRRRRPCRLLVLGEGELRPRLTALADELGVTEDCAFPGFAENPYSFMARAAVFVLSSRWEGSPNVLTEALALGRPVVATDCPSGPREVLADGRLGPLVPMGDPPALAEALCSTLAMPLGSETLRSAVADYTAERSADAYLRTLGIESADSLSGPNRVRRG